MKQNKYQQAAEGGDASSYDLKPFGSFNTVSREEAARNDFHITCD